VIELTDGQQKGLELAIRLAKEPRGVGVICGPAGSGKTSLIRSIVESELKDSILLSPTGKAAVRITELTGCGAGTIHRWLYHADGKNGVVTFKRKGIDEIYRPKSGLIIVDEASMVGPDVWNDLLEAASLIGCSILLIGDSFQLPPVQNKGERPFSVLDPDFVDANRRVELTEILRQALDSPIIRTTVAIREGDIFEVLMDTDMVLPEELDGELLRADMVICRTNKVRHQLNVRCRDLRGYVGEPKCGEPILVLKNSYRLDIYNGEIHTFGGFADDLGNQSVYDCEAKAHVPIRFKTTAMGKGHAAIAANSLDGSLDHLPPHSMEKAVSYWQKKGIAFYAQVNYGYALTCHRAQGSEADYVLVCMEPKFNYAGEEGRRWAYTALSRAKKRVAITHIR
jgi:exodeoxyribonuclease-5